MVLTSSKQRQLNKSQPLGYPDGEDASARSAAHGLNHAGATPHGRAGAAFLGHEDVSTTPNTYTHVADSDRITTYRTMNEIIKGLAYSENCSGNAADTPNTTNLKVISFAYAAAKIKEKAIVRRDYDNKPKGGSNAARAAAASLLDPFCAQNTIYLSSPLRSDNRVLLGRKTTL